MKNSCYNTKKKVRNKNKISKEKIFNINSLKMREFNSLDYNHENKKYLDIDLDNNYYKEICNNKYKIENKYKKSNHKQTNLKAYFGNNKFNYKNNTKNINNTNNISNSNYEIDPNISKTDRKLFFSNPNLSPKEVFNLNNDIYNIKNNLKNKRVKTSYNFKPLGKDNNNKISSNSKNKKNLSKKNNESNNNKFVIKDNLKDKAKNHILNPKNKYNINKNSSTPKNDGHKKNKYHYIKLCHTLPTKYTISNSDNNINTMFSEWLMLTLNKYNRKNFTNKDSYIKKNKVISKKNKSLSEFADKYENKINCRMLLSKSNINAILKNIKSIMKNEAKSENNSQNYSLKKNNHHDYSNSIKIINKKKTFYQKINLKHKIEKNNQFLGRNTSILKKLLDKLKYINPNNNSNLNTIYDYNSNYNNSYLRKFINNNIHTFIYDSKEKSKTEDKSKKIIKKQLVDPSEIKNKKINNDNSMVYKNEINKFGKIIPSNKFYNSSCYNENCLNNINFNNLININNFQNNKNCNFIQNNNGNNHYIKNSRLKKKIFSNILNKNITRKEMNKKFGNFSNELKNYYLDTENFKNNTYSNFIKNNISLSNYDLSNDDKNADEILIYLFKKIFSLFNKEKSGNYFVFDSLKRKILNIFPLIIRKILNRIINILCKNLGKIKRSNRSNNSILNTTNNNEYEYKIDKYNFISEMIYIYKNCLSKESKKILISYKDKINKIVNDYFINKDNFENSKYDFISSKSYQKSH